MRLRNKGDMGCQWAAYCPECKAINNIPHEEGCLGRKVEISATARFPRKNASKRAWDKFYEKFVLQKDLKEFFELERRTKAKHELKRDSANHSIEFEKNPARIFL